MGIRVLILSCLIVAAFASYAAAQDTLPAPASEPTQTTPAFQVPTTNFVEDFVREQQDLWRTPFKIKRGNAKWLVPFGVGVAGLLITDDQVADAARRSGSLRPTSRFVSKFGGGAPMAVASGGLWGLGKLTHNEKATETGRLATEALLHTQLVVQGLKMTFNRERPNKVGGNSGFWDGGRSFPSGHAATTFSFATVVADRYKNKKLVAVGAYGLATAVSFSRIGGMNHHPSDVAIGAVVGHLIGRYILNRHPAEH